MELTRRSNLTVSGACEVWQPEILLRCGSQRRTAVLAGPRWMCAPTGRLLLAASRRWSLPAASLGQAASGHGARLVGVAAAAQCHIVTESQRGIRCKL